MSLDLTCPFCQQPFPLAAEQAGKHANCPHCGKQFPIPASEVRLTPKVDQGADPQHIAPATIWYVQAEDGRQFGPVTEGQLQAWYEEGRITANCQLLRKGAEQWQWATDLYPDLHQIGEKQPVGPAAAKPAPPKQAPDRPTPPQSAAPITPLSPSDFPTTGSGLKSLGPVLRPLPPGYGEPRLHSFEALEDRRKFAPFMVAHMHRPPLHKMLLVLGIANFVVGTLRAVLYFALFLGLLGAIGAVDERGDERVANRAAVSLGIAFVMFVLNIFVISGGVGLLQQKEWGRAATFAGTLIGMIIQLTCVCVTMLLGADGSGLAGVIWIVLLALLLPSVLYDAFAAAALTLPSVVKDLEE